MERNAKREREAFLDGYLLRAAILKLHQSECFFGCFIKVVNLLDLVFVSIFGMRHVTTGSIVRFPSNIQNRFTVILSIYCKHLRSFIFILNVDRIPAWTCLHSPAAQV